jgi:hypothetical protein
MHVYPMLTLICADFGIKTTMCDLHINVKMGFPISVNSTQPIIIVSYCHFRVGYIQVYFSVKTYTSKYQQDMYVKKFITNILRYSNSLFFNIRENGCIHTWVHPSISRG